MGRPVMSSPALARLWTKKDGPGLFLGYTIVRGRFANFLIIFQKCSKIKKIYSFPSQIWGDSGSQVYLRNQKQKY